MFMISVQGAWAMSLNIPEKQQRSFESAVNAIVGSKALYIFSPYRCDIIYQAKRSYNYEISQIWRLYAAHEGASRSSRFFFSEGKKDTLEGFFVRLIYLSANKRWFNGYVKNLRLQLAVNANHRIAKALTECQRYINNDGIHRMFDIRANAPELPHPGDQLMDNLSREYLDDYPVN